MKKSFSEFFSVNIPQTSTVMDQPENAEDRNWTGLDEENAAMEIRRSLIS